MSQIARLLVYLNPDPAHLADITRYLYRSGGSKYLRQTRRLINQARTRNGWAIESITQDDGQYYLIAETLWQFIQECQPLVLHWGGERGALTPENVETYRRL